MVFLFILVSFLFPLLAHAQDYNLVGNDQFGVLNNIQANDYVSFAVNVLLGLAGVLAFLYLLWGGVQWITAGGDKDGVDKGRRKILQALIGLSVVFSVYVVVAIINTLFDINIIQFSIPQLNP